MAEPEEKQKAEEKEPRHLGRAILRAMVMLVIGVLLAGAAWLLYENRPASDGPEYNGKSAQQWLAEVFGNHGQQSQALAAFREMGSNAFPVLVQALAKKETPADKVNRWIYPRLPQWLQSHWTKPAPVQQQETLWSAAELVFINVRGGREALPELTRLAEDKKLGSKQYTLALVAQFAGPKDTECVPALIDGLAAKDFATRYQVFHGLMNIGPGAMAAVPALTNLLSGTNIDTRALAAVTLWKINGRTDEAVAALREVMGAPGHPYMKSWAPVYLHQINPHDESLIPDFIAKLEGPDTSEGVRLSAVTALTGYGPAAKAAVPALTNLLNSPNADMRTRVMLALKRIDPETAAKYETEVTGRP